MLNSWEIVEIVAFFCEKVSCCLHLFEIILSSFEIEAHLFLIEL
jgi:hypothetical protein